jgi:hypothetical protein
VPFAVGNAAPSSELLNFASGPCHTIGLSHIPGLPESGANVHAHLVIKKVWRKVKGTRKKWEKVLPEANRVMAEENGGHGFESRRRHRLPELNGGRTSSAAKTP